MTFDAKRAMGLAERCAEYANPTEYSLLATLIPAVAEQLRAAVSEVERLREDAASDHQVMEVLREGLGRFESAVAARAEARNKELLAEREQLRGEVERLKAERDAARSETLTALVLWVNERWDAEVKNRPVENIHRRTLDGTWKQVLAKLDKMLDSLPSATEGSGKPSLGANIEDLEFAARLGAVEGMEKP